MWVQAVVPRASAATLTVRMVPKTDHFRMLLLRETAL